MKRLALHLICSLAVFSSTANAQEAKGAAERAEALRVVDVWLNSVQAYQHIPAISAGVVVGDDLVWSKGFWNHRRQPHCRRHASDHLLHLLDLQALYVDRTDAAQ